MASSSSALASTSAAALSGPARARTPLNHAVHSVFPWKSFVGLFDLKQGCAVISLFGLFNKIVGVFGMMALLTGGSFAQVSLYLYSLATIFAVLWGMRGISDEDANSVLRYAHFFVADHLISSIWTFYFAHQVYSAPHNGEPPATGKYQQELMQLIEQLESEYGETRKHSESLTGQARIDAAQQVWNYEKPFATLSILLGWFLKIFFALTLYSYALHLRHNTYASLPLAKSSSMNVALHARRTSRSYSLTALGDSDDSSDQLSGAQPRRNQPIPSVHVQSPRTSTQLSPSSPGTSPRKGAIPLVSVRTPHAQHGQLVFGRDLTPSSTPPPSNDWVERKPESSRKDRGSTGFVPSHVQASRGGSRRQSHVYQDSIAFTEPNSSTYGTPLGSAGGTPTH